MFTSSRKFDGVDFRHISGGEYIQMSGRAGRRGLDDRGIVIQMVDEKLEPSAARSILKGGADPLNSSFHLGYNMLLNLLRVEVRNAVSGCVLFWRRPLTCLMCVCVCVLAPCRTPTPTQ